DLDQTPNTWTINVTSVNDPPVAVVASPQLAILKSTSHNFNAGDFGFTDPLDTAPTGPGPANKLANVYITQAFSGPAGSSLTYQGGAVPLFPTPIPFANLSQLVY